MIILEYLLILLLLISAFLAVIFNEELISIICLSVFSVALTALYLIYKAPDVALAEAVIGAGLNTVIFMTAISQVRSGKTHYISEEEK